jgi:flavin reductase (DIM6/NTAB) family NADH-FMN oxidoreductase RutF
VDFGIESARRQAEIFRLRKCLTPIRTFSSGLLICIVTQIILSGDHAIVVGLVEAAATEDGDPLLYFGGQYGTFAST